MKQYSFLQEGLYFGSFKIKAINHDIALIKHAIESFETAKQFLLWIVEFPKHAKILQFTDIYGVKLAAETAKSNNTWKSRAMDSLAYLVKQLNIKYHTNKITL